MATKQEIEDLHASVKRRALARYIVRWLRIRNTGELAEALDHMRVGDLNLMIRELDEILRHGGHPPNWAPLPEDP